MQKADDPALIGASMSWAMTLDDRARRQGKLAPKLARLIETEVLRLGWPVGRFLGKEEALALRFGVSRSVLREAMAITERDGVTRRQRGRSGGIHIAEPAQQSVIMTLGNYLVSAGLNEAHYSEAYGLLNGLALRLAAERCTAEDAHSARELAARPLEADLDATWRRINQLNQRLLAMSRNRVIEIFCAATVYSGMQRLYAALLNTEPAAALEFAQYALRITTHQLECVIAGDTASALVADREIIQRWQCYYLPCMLPAVDSALAQRVVEGITAIYHPDKSVKRADVLAYRIQRDIAAGGFQPGDRLDCETILLHRYQVSRGALRDAIRALEQHGIVKMEEGRGGGLCVAEADPSAVVRSAVIYFRFLGLDAGDFSELSADLEMALATSVAQQAAAKGGGVLDAFSRAIRPSRPPRTPAQAQEILEAIYASLATASGNPYLVLLVKTLTAFLSVDDTSQTRSRPLNAEEYARYLARLVVVERALLAGDVGLARRGLLQARQQDMQLSPQPRDLRQLMNRLYE